MTQIPVSCSLILLISIHVCFFSFSSCPCIYVEVSSLFSIHLDVFLNTLFMVFFLFLILIMGMIDFSYWVCVGVLCRLRFRHMLF